MKSYKISACESERMGNPPTILFIIVVLARPTVVTLDTNVTYLQGN
jgi:hypothetical protein